MPRSSYYRRPSRPPVTRWAKHIDAWMEREGLSQTGAFRKLREAVDLGPESRSAFLPYLEDKAPNASQAERLAKLIGQPPEVDESDPVTAPEAPDATALIAAMTQALLAQTQALTDIRLQLADARREAQAQRETTAELLGHLSDQLAELRTLAGTRGGSAVPASDR